MCGGYVYDYMCVVVGMCECGYMGGIVSVQMGVW